MHYLALVEVDPAGGFGVIVPDLPGCTSAGDTFDEAADNAVDAVRDYVEVTLDHGDRVREPRSIAELVANPEIAACLASGAVLAAVPVLAKTGRHTRISLTIDQNLLAAIDRTARRVGDTRSAFLARAAERRIRETKRAIRGSTTGAAE